MTSVSWRVPAKVNLSLDVGPRRPDGFHDLATVFHAIDLADIVTATTLDTDASDDPMVTVEAAHDAIDVTEVPNDAANLAVRAVTALAERVGRSPDVALRVVKSIPVAAGLAGGSADAAGALLACNDLWGSGLTTEELRRIGADLGSDVPFAVAGGTALGTGRGERLEPVPVRDDLHWVVVAGVSGLSTPAVYHRLDDLRITGRAAAPRDVLERPTALLDALADGDIDAVAAAVRNDLQAAAVDLAPELADTLAAGRTAGARAAMVSGSGPTCIFLAGSRSNAKALATAVEAHGFAGRVTVATGPSVPQRVH